MIESSTIGIGQRIFGRLFYWWSLFAAAFLLLTIGTPVIAIARIIRRRSFVYPFAWFGARNWLRLCGAKINVRGLEHLDPYQSYVFIMNHRSFLDTAAAFSLLGRKVGLLAKKELLKFPILGVGMGFVDILAIDRSNRERAITTVRAATDKLSSGLSFGVFAEGTRAKPGEFLPFKKGAFYMARDTGVPVVPVAIKNTDRMMGKGTGMAFPGKFEIVIMEPVPTSANFTDAEVKDLIDVVHQRIGSELSASLVTARIMA